MGYEGFVLAPWTVIVLLAAGMALAACAPGGATGSGNAAPEDEGPPAGRPAAVDDGDDGARDDT